MDAEINAPGWDAIEAAFSHLYPGQAPLRSGATRNRATPETVAVQAWAGESHWHLVTLGLSELWEKESQNDTLSGWGVELTLRLPRDPSDKRPPAWPLTLLKHLVAMVEQSGFAPAPGQRINLAGPVDGSPDTTTSAMLLTPDPAFDVPLETPNGQLAVLQVVGITAEESQTLEQGGDPNTLLQRLREASPGLVTLLRR